MPVVRRIRNRGATITVESNAEVLFMPSGSVHNWTNRFTGRIRAATIGLAPTNERPRWGHYGKPLKDTIVSARPRFWGNGKDRQRVYGAVGSTAPHAWYVDQGTGIHNQSSPWRAKVLPPRERGGADLYEHTWRPGGPGGRRVAPIWIQGQRGQKFFERGLNAAFQSMRLRSAHVANEAKIGAVLSSTPTGLDNFRGNTPNDAAFRASLTQWRKDRDAAYKRNEDFRSGDARLKPAKPPKVKAPVPTSPTKPTKPRKLDPAQREAIRDRVAAALRAQGRDFRNLTIKSDGTWTALIKQGNIFKPTTGRWRK